MDAVVFSYIHVILNIPLYELNEVQVQSNLVKYSERIYNEYILSGF